MRLHIRNARVLTHDNDTILPPLPITGSALNTLQAISSANITIDDGIITSVLSSSISKPISAIPHEQCSEIDANGRVLIPAFVDCHTHLCWAGNRLDEWTQKLNGAAYLDIFKAGGGIMSTVRAVRDATEAQLVDILLSRLETSLHHGTTTIEIKSGYGLNTHTEIKMLRAIVRAGELWAGTVVPTACIGHALDPDVDHEVFIARTINETLPEVSRQFPGVAIDAYCESGAWSVDECCALFDAAHTAGHPCRIHADQFNSLGMLSEAIDRTFVSVDHLEATSIADLAMLAQSNTFGVMLPIAGFHTDDRYANGRAFIDAGGSLAIATNCNPGSAPSVSMPLAIALAVRKNTLTPEEAICACTRNSAALLGYSDRGSIREGARADLVLLDTTDERELAHTLGGNPVATVICNGVVV